MEPEDPCPPTHHFSGLFHDLEAEDTGPEYSSLLLSSSLSLSLSLSLAEVVINTRSLRASSFLGP